MPDLDQNPDGPAGEQRKELLHLVQTGQIPNGFLFTGAPGTGKARTAIWVAKACNCRGQSGLSEPDPEKVPCESCPSCKKINAGMHPDCILIDLEDDKRNISISQIRDMGRLISARPNEARFRLVLIRNADLMNIQAQNGLLKSLEEPPEQTFFILTAAQGASLLPTIRSRCRKFRFQAFSAARILNILETRHGIPPEEAGIALGTLGTDLGRILDCLTPDKESPSNWQQTRHWLITALTQMIQSPAPQAKCIRLSQFLSQTPERIKEALPIIRTVMRDLTVFKYSPEKIVNLDFFDAFKDISQMYSQTTLLEWVTAFHETETRLASNAGARLTLDRFFLAITSVGSNNPSMLRTTTI